jgi:hypothetical protein
MCSILVIDLKLTPVRHHGAYCSWSRFYRRSGHARYYRSWSRFIDAFADNQSRTPEKAFGFGNHRLQKSFRTPSSGEHLGDVTCRDEFLRALLGANKEII